MIMYLTTIYLSLFMCLLLMVMLMNKSVVIFTMKMTHMNFFLDFEIVISIWSLLFLCMVMLISISVMFFSYSYMSSLNTLNFMMLYISFLFSMMWLIINNNFYWMMLGWDGLGVVSFLLIMFYMNYESINNGLFTLFQNRLGDLSFVLFMVGMVCMDITTNVILKWGILFLMIGSSVKSAQFPFNSWLLTAMSAPTPISSLVHSSTLVVAGVYVMLQYSYCLLDILEILKYISLCSLLLSSLGLLNESDMKKLIAYSTLSHVSLMMFMMSLKLFKVTYFHLNIHAMFKSLMFMCFGFVMLYSYHGQDKRLITLAMLNPVIKIIYYFACFCLAGLPFLSGFFSKDLMIEKVMSSALEWSNIILLWLFLSVSIYYSVKLMKIGGMVCSYTLLEKNYLGIFSILMMSMIMVIMINLYLSLVFSLSLEMISYKLYIYLLMSMFFFLSLLTNLNFKFKTYAKLQNFKEVWSLPAYTLDQYVYWNMFLFVEYLTSLSNFKMILFLNWWVIVLTMIVI